MVFNLVYVKGDDVGDRISIVHVKPDKERDYMQMIVAGTGIMRKENIVDEECVYEICWNEKNWETNCTQTIHAASSSMTNLKSELDNAIG